jgi:hypothetical protein
MKFRIGDTIAYKDPQASLAYGLGVVTLVTEAEYTILWQRRGSKRYRRLILDHKLAEVFQREGGQTSLPKERVLQLGASKNGIPLNENYDCAKVKVLCEVLKKSRSQSAKSVVDGLTAGLLQKKITPQARTREVLWHLAELCSNNKAGDAFTAARQISQELFFGYVIQKSDFNQQ